MLWAWERAEDLRALDQRTGVAFLAQTITIHAHGIRVDPRRWPLRITDDAVLSAVTRIEFPAADAPTADAEPQIALAIAHTATLPNVAGVQIDFDAVVSQRAFYRRVIERVRARLDDSVSLSITALASWCVGDPWLDRLPIDEAVPMLFQLGPLNEPYREIALSPDAAHATCRSSVGTSMDEPLRVVSRGRRVYVFNPKPWTEESMSLARDYATGLKGPS